MTIIIRYGTTEIKVDNDTRLDSLRKQLQLDDDDTIFPNFSIQYNSLINPEENNLGLEEANESDYVDGAKVSTPERKKNQIFKKVYKFLGEVFSKSKNQKINFDSENDHEFILLRNENCDVNDTYVATIDPHTASSDSSPFLSRKIELPNSKTSFFQNHPGLAFFIPSKQFYRDFFLNAALIFAFSGFGALAGVALALPLLQILGLSLLFFTLSSIFLASQALVIKSWLKLKAEQKYSFANNLAVASVKFLQKFCSYLLPQSRLWRSVLLAAVLITAAIMLVNYFIVGAISGLAAFATVLDYAAFCTLGFSLLFRMLDSRQEYIKYQEVETYQGLKLEFDKVHENRATMLFSNDKFYLFTQHELTDKERGLDAFVDARRPKGFAVNH